MAIRPMVRQDDVVARRILGAIFRISGLEAGYGAVSVLHGVTIDVREGETVALLGTNGNGKSTLAKEIHHGHGAAQNPPAPSKLRWTAPGSALWA